MHTLKFNPGVSQKGREPRKNHGPAGGGGGGGVGNMREKTYYEGKKCPTEGTMDLRK
jgi:hypothetical protein